MQQGEAGLSLRPADDSNYSPVSQPYGTRPAQLTPQGIYLAAAGNRQGDGDWSLKADTSTRKQVRRRHTAAAGGKPALMLDCNFQRRPVCACCRFPSPPKRS